MMEKAKQKGKEELLEKREKIKGQLEELLQKTGEFEHCSEMDMIQQVQSHQHFSDLGGTKFYISSLAESKIRSSIPLSHLPVQ